MKWHPFRALASLSTLVALLVPARVLERGVSAQDADAPAAKKDVSAKQIAEMRRFVERFQTVAIAEGRRTPVPLEREPLHRWTDPTRGTNDGALWVWRPAPGVRPVAALAINLNLENLKIWSFEFISLSTGLVESNDGQLRWEPREPGLVFKEIPGAPAPAASEAARHRQVRDLAKRFSGTEYWKVTDQNYPLRMLPHPIDRYHDHRAGLVDGAIFVFANGTNPEALLLIEAQKQGDGPPKWTYAAQTLTTAAPTLKLDRKEVWTTPNKYGYLFQEAYFFGEVPRVQTDP
jgi:hypothetical protein